MLVSYTQLHSKIFDFSRDFPTLAAESIAEFDRDHLLNAIKKLIDEIRVLKVENELNERFLRKNDVELLNGILASTKDTENRKTKIQFAESVHEHRTDLHTVGTPTGLSSENSLSLISEANSSLRSRRTSSISSTGTFQRNRQPVGLSLAVKTGICENECEVERAALHTFQQNMKTRFTELLAEVEEIKLTNQDVCHARELFTDFVILKGEIIVACFVRVVHLFKFLGTENNEVGGGEHYIR